MPEETPNIPPESVHSVFRHWEWLRLVYNFVLALVLLPWLGEFVSNRKFTVFVIESALVANLCFCTGSVIEGYAALIGVPRKVSRYTLFAFGTLFSVAVEILLIHDFLHPESD